MHKFRTQTEKIRKTDDAREKTTNWLLFTIVGPDSEKEKAFQGSALGMAAFTVGWTPVRRVKSWHSEVAKTATIKSSNCRQELEQHTRTHTHTSTHAQQHTTYGFHPCFVESAFDRCNEKRKFGSCGRILMLHRMQENVLAHMPSTQFFRRVAECGALHVNAVRPVVKMGVANMR